MNALINYLRRRSVVTGIYAIIVLISLSTLLNWYNGRVMAETELATQRTKLVKFHLELMISSTLQQSDLGLRGYALTHNEKLLGSYHSAMGSYKNNLRKLDSLLTLQGISTTDLAVVGDSIESYMKFVRGLKKMVDQNDQDQFLTAFKRDLGTVCWQVIHNYQNKIIPLEDGLAQEAKANYASAVFRNQLLQGLLFALGVPVLLFATARLNRQANEHRELLRHLDRNNRTYLFDPGAEEHAASELNTIINDTILHLKRASAFVKNVAAGNLSAEWEGLNEGDRVRNTANLAGDLLHMRAQMLTVKAEDERRFWANEGLTRFSELARKHQHDLDSFANETTRFLTKYLGAQQASLFVAKEAAGATSLELMACYAFDRKKFLEKEIRPGEGIVGQAYLEAATTLLTQLPPHYLSITSGLGEAAPTCVVVVPMKYNNHVEALLELASFAVFKPHEIEFLEKAGEFIASVLVNAKTTLKMKNLLDELQVQTGRMRTQEEEMRQNVEELQATQEEMYRREHEYKQLIETLQQSTPSSTSSLT